MFCRKRLLVTVFVLIWYLGAFQLRMYVIETNSISKKKLSARNEHRKTTKSGVKLMNFSEAFPIRSEADIRINLSRGKEIMMPVIKELEIIQWKLLSQNKTWMQPKTPKTVLMSSSAIFTEALQHHTVDVLHDDKKETAQGKIRTIPIWARLETLKQMFPSRFFMDYTSNDCETLEQQSIYGNHQGKVMFNASCVETAEAAWRPKSFNSGHFKEGLPSNVTVHNSSHIMVNYIHVIQNGAVDTSGDVAFGKVKIIISRCNMQSKKKAIKPRKDKIFTEVFTLAQFWGSGFYHATVEDLTRIAPFLDFLRKNPQIKVHLCFARTFMEAFLQHLGISASRIVVGTIGARILFVPAGTSCGRPATFPTQMLSLELRQNTPTEPGTRQSIVLIKRTIKRRFKYHNLILRMLKSVAAEKKNLGLKVEVYPDDPVPSLTDTLAMMSRAFMVIAPHGAGEANVIMSEPGTVMIEGLCKVRGRANLCYRNLAQVLGHRYCGILSPDSCYSATPKTIEAPLRRTLKQFLNL